MIAGSQRSSGYSGYGDDQGGELNGFLSCSYNEKQAILQRLLADHVQVGFLMTFCESQYCTENIRFIVAVAKYKLLFKQDGINWDAYSNVDSQDLKKEMPVHPDKVREIEKDIQFIVSSFLDPSAKLEICMPTKVAANTFRRIKEWKAYGPEVFDEAMIDPRVTLSRDIMPRFIVSSTFWDMKYFLHKISNLPVMTSLKLPPITVSPTFLSDITSSLTTDNDELEYVNNLENYMVDPILYNQLLKYLTRIVASESLLCVHAVDVYHELFAEIERKKLRIMDGSTFSTVEMDQVAHAAELSGKVDGSSRCKLEQIMRGRIVGQAWQIYLYFVAPDSCFEVGISHKLMQSVNRNMAAPTANIFDGLRETALKCLLDHFSKSFKSSPCYQELLKMVKARGRSFKESKSGFSIGCFSCFQPTPHSVVPEPRKIA